MAKQDINYGTAAGDGTGESLFAAFKKAKENFDELYGEKTEFVANYAALPATGEALKIYVALDTGVMYRWSGSAYVQMTLGFTTDASGNTVLVGADGVPIIVGMPAIDPADATTTVTVPAGSRTSVALAAGRYRIDSDMDIYVTGSAASSLLGAELTADTDAYMTSAGSLAAQTGLDFGIADFSFEAWFQLNESLTNSAIFDISGAAGTAGTGRTQMTFYAARTLGGTKLQLDLTLKGPDGANIEGPDGSVELAAYPLGDTLYHLVCTVHRGAALGTGTATWYVNGAQVLLDTWTEAATVAPMDLNTNDGATTRMYIGALGGNPEWNGRIEDIKLYKYLLTLAQVQARNNAGPLRSLGLDVADASLSWWMSFQAGVATCETGYGNATFVALGSPAITERTGGAAATTSDTKIYAAQTETLTMTAANLSIYSDSLSSGNVRLLALA